MKLLSHFKYLILLFPLNLLAHPDHQEIVFSSDTSANDSYVMWLALTGIILCLTVAYTTTRQLQKIVSRSESHSIDE